jgi:hypothetical protein
MSCLFEGVPIVLHLRSVHILPGWRVYVQSCHTGVEEWTNKFQLDLEVRNIYQDCKFFLSVTYHNLKMERYMFSLQLNDDQ